MKSSRYAGQTEERGQGIPWMSMVTVIVVPLWRRNKVEDGGTDGAERQLGPTFRLLWANFDSVVVCCITVRTAPGTRTRVISCRYHYALGHSHMISWTLVVRYISSTLMY